jgi:hypothetical protein
MDRQQIGLKLALDALGQELLLDDFASRLTLQKATYLAQALGVDLGYSFNWYRRGPYSPGLTRDAFALQAEFERDPEAVKGWTLDSTSVARLQGLRGLFERTPTEQLPRLLELLASVHFLLYTGQGDPTDVPQLQVILLRNNKDFPEAEIQEAVEELRRHGLCPAGGKREAHR